MSLARIVLKMTSAVTSLRGHLEDFSYVFSSLWDTRVFAGFYESMRNAELFLWDRTLRLLPGPRQSFYLSDFPQAPFHGTWSFLVVFPLFRAAPYSLHVERSFSLQPPSPVQARRASSTSSTSPPSDVIMQMPQANPLRGLIDVTSPTRASPKPMTSLRVA